MRSSIALTLPLLLAACPGTVRPTLPEVVRIPVEVMVGVPDELTEPCLTFEAREQTYAEAKRLALLRLESLEACNRDKARIRALAP